MHLPHRFGYRSERYPAPAWHALSVGRCHRRIAFVERATPADSARRRKYGLGRLGGQAGSPLLDFARHSPRRLSERCRAAWRVGVWLPNGRATEGPFRWTLRVRDCRRRTTATPPRSSLL